MVLKEWKKVDAVGPPLIAKTLDDFGKTTATVYYTY